VRAGSCLSWDSLNPYTAVPESNYSLFLLLWQRWRKIPNHSVSFVSAAIEEGTPVELPTGVPYSSIETLLTFALANRLSPKKSLECFRDIWLKRQSHDSGSIIDHSDSGDSLIAIASNLSSFNFEHSFCALMQLIPAWHCS
jgi:hypothetical protein